MWRKGESSSGCWERLQASGLIPRPLVRSCPHHQALATRDASVAEKQRLLESKEHENKAVNEALHRAHKDLDSEKELRLNSEKQVGGWGVVHQ